MELGSRLDRFSNVTLGCIPVPPSQKRVVVLQATIAELDIKISYVCLAHPEDSYGTVSFKGADCTSYARKTSEPSRT